MDKRVELSAVADALTAGGVPSAIDPRDLTPPAAWVHLGPWTYDTLCGDVSDVQMIVDLIAPDVGTLDALGLLDDIETLAVLVLGPPRAPVTPTTIQLPDSGTALPCYRLTYQVEMS